MKTVSKSKTFQKEDQLHETVDWMVSQLEIHDWQPEGTEWSGGEPGPHDPRSDLKFKYIITVTKVL